MLLRFVRGVNAFRVVLDRHTVLEERLLSVMGWLIIAAMTVPFAGYVVVTLLSSNAA